jgi:dihydroneopterin triphosphate diphosphatase
MVRQKRSVEIYLFRKKEKNYEFLLLKRVSSGFWSPITGGLEDNETPLEALNREIFEETGINKIIRIVDLQSYIWGDNIENIVFGVEVDKDSKITFDYNVYEEHSEHKWVSYKESIKLLHWDNQKQGLTKLQKLI